MKKCILLVMLNVLLSGSATQAQIDYSTLTVFTTGLNVPNEIVFDTSGYLYVANHTYASYSGPYANTIAKIDAAGNKTVFVSGYTWPSGLAIDKQQNLYFTQNNASSNITKVTPAGAVSTFVSLSHLPGPITLFDNSDPTSFAIFTVSLWGIQGINKTLFNGAFSLFDAGSYYGCQLTSDGQYLYAYKGSSNNLMVRFNTATAVMENWVTTVQDYEFWASTIGPDGKLYFVARSTSDTTKKAIFRVNGYNDVTEVINNLPYNSEFNDVAFNKNGNSYDLYVSQVLDGNRMDPASNRIIKYLNVIIPSAPVAITITASANNVCSGSLVTFTAIPVNGGSAPQYQWKVNGINAGTNNPVFTYAPANNDAVTCMLTSNAPGATGNPATSNAIVVHVFSVNATVSQNSTVCQGTPVTLIASGGTNYLWSNGMTNDTIVVSPAATTTYYVTVSNGMGCADTDSVKVTVNPRPLPAITGPNTACAVSTGNVYATQPGMSGYTWIVSSGGVLTAGAGTNSITVTWNTVGMQTVSVNYTNASGCTAAAATIFQVNVGLMPAPTISGQGNLCASSGYYNYTTEAGMISYQWAVSTGGTITWGAGTNQVQVTWNTPGIQWVSVNYVNATGCTAPSPTQFTVNVLPLPGPAGPITGTPVVCAGTYGVSYSVTSVPNTSTYVWTLPPGAVVESGAGTNSILVNFLETATTGNISVYANNLCGNGALSPGFGVMVYPIPPAPSITYGIDTLFSNAPDGNQWYRDGVAINGALLPYYLPTISGEYWVKVTMFGCSSDTSNHIFVLLTGTEQLQAQNISVFPVPNAGRFMISFDGIRGTSVDISVINELGICVYEKRNLAVTPSLDWPVNLSDSSPGLYSVVITGENLKITRKIIVE